MYAFCKNTYVFSIPFHASRSLLKVTHWAFNFILNYKIFFLHFLYHLYKPLSLIVRTPVKRSSCRCPSGTTGCQGNCSCLGCGFLSVSRTGREARTNTWAERNTPSSLLSQVNIGYNTDVLVYFSRTVCVCLFVSLKKTRCVWYLTKNYELAQHHTCNTRILEILPQFCTYL